MLTLPCEGLSCLLLVLYVTYAEDAAVFTPSLVAADGGKEER